MFALFMGIAWPPVAATQFTAYMAMLNLSYGIGAKLAAPLASAFDLRTLYFVFAAFQVVLLILVMGIDPHETRRRLGGIEDGAEEEGEPETGPPL